MANFSANAFRAATPGLGRLASALSGGAFEQGQQNQIKFESNLANQLASQQAHEASAALNTEKVGAAQREAALQTPEAITRNAMTSAGIPLDEESAVTGFLKTGQLGGKYRPLSANEQGPVAPQPEWSPNLGNLARSIGAVQNALTLGDKNSENVAKATQINRESSLGDQVLRGNLDPTLFAQAQYATKGNAPFHFSEYGVGNNLTGNVDATGEPAQRFGNLRMAETGKNVQQAGAAKANAAESYAGVGLKKAQTDKARQDIDLGSKGTIQQTDQGMVLVDPRSGIARPVMGQDGKPIAGKVKELTEGQAKDNGYGSRMMEADSTLNALAGKYSPAAVNARVSAQNSVIPGSGMLANAMLSESGQQVEQAQRDFINAILRRESGAAIAPSEFANATQQYFPQPNDKPETLKQKARNRKIAIEGVFSSVPKDRRGVPSLKNPAGTQAQTADTGGFIYLGTE